MHLKVIALGVVFGVTVAVATATMRSDDAVKVGVVKAGKTVVVTQRDQSIR